MSKKANLTTLRTQQPYFKLVQSTNYLYLKHLNFLKIFIFFLQKKGIWVVKSLLTLNNSLCKFSLNIFLATKTIRSYRSRLKPHKIENVKPVLTLKNLNHFIYKLFKKPTVLFNLKFLNPSINLKFLKNLHSETKKYKSTLFQRRFNLYFDTLKIITLFSQNLVHTSYFLFILSTIFKYLSKKLHKVFLTFLSQIIYSLVYNPYTEDYRSKNSLGTLKGIKFKINGKLKGKMRASNALITYGKIPNQSIGINIEYSLIHTFTRYGAFGMQAWIYK